MELAGKRYYSIILKIVKFQPYILKKNQNDTSPFMRDTI
jgi:hypothetical protein